MIVTQQQLLQAQHKRCEAHRLWAKAFEDVLSGTTTISSYAAMVNTLIGAMQAVSNTFRGVRDGDAANHAATVRDWAGRVQTLEKDLYDVTVSMQRVGLMHSTEADGAEGGTTVSPETEKVTTSGTVVVQHCGDCAIARFAAQVRLLSSSSHNDTALVKGDCVDAPVMVASWSIDDDRNTLQRCEEDESGAESDENDDGAILQQRRVAASSCRRASNEWLQMRAAMVNVQQQLAEIVEEGVELLVDGDVQ